MPGLNKKSSKKRRVTKREEDDEDKENEGRAEENGHQSTSRAQASEMAMDEDDMGDANGQGEVDMAPEFHFDPENFTDLPLGKEEEMEILKGITGEWSQLAKTLNPEGFQLTANVARTVADRADEAEWNERSEELNTLMRDMINLHKEVQIREKTVDNLRQRVLRGEEITDVLDQWRTNTDQQIEAYHALTSRQKFAKNDAYSKYWSGVWEAKHQDAMPPITAFLPREDGDEEDDEDEIEIGGVTQDYKCPLTLTLLVEPMTSKKCKHSFSKAAILEYLGRGTKRCPAAGCNKELRAVDLEEDEDLARRTKEAAKREERRREEEEDQIMDVVDDD
ncbi:hypothetical protein SISNIDRAFT_488374 [Sistotremastrum niveocremeum HHB9708]|uniref:SP-RING-type domain-containing protein n=1 Tax=Sistotremastrum niveocremeum HHB9708 TaxID=1314777 RepID=A0A164RF66_9AGAM|nr:hypothetical protein SISNIDRAFT_488374 [Sistotremastrum niveocremeum HHB9708]